MKIFQHTEEILGDTFTPIGIFLALRDKFANVSLFESSDFSSKENAKSYIVADPIVSLQIFQNETQVRINNKLVESNHITSSDQLSLLIESFDFQNKILASNNGFFGVIAYDAIPLFEKIKFKTCEDELPIVYLSAYRFVIEFDHFHHRLKLINNLFNESENELSVLIQEINKKVLPSENFKINGGISSSETDQSFEEKVLKAKAHVARGDVFQLVLSRQFQQKFEGDDFEVYRQLRTINPSPYMFYLDIDKAKLIGASPEAQLKVSRGLAEIHPIAGTIKKSNSDVEDEKHIALLKVNEKENAEHIMLVDLARNDLNQNCTKVQVASLKEVQKFSHVIHLVSRVTGQVNQSKSINVFKGSFPAGTLSGAPKYKAMELIDKYEAVSRKYYGGAVGMFAANGDINTAIVIRTALSYKNNLIYQA